MNEVSGMDVGGYQQSYLTSRVCLWWLLVMAGGCLEERYLRDDSMHDEHWVGLEGQVLPSQCSFFLVSGDKSHDSRHEFYHQQKLGRGKRWRSELI